MHLQLWNFSEFKTVRLKKKKKEEEEKKLFGDFQLQFNSTLFP